MSDYILFALLALVLVVLIVLIAVVLVFLRMRTQSHALETLSGQLDSGLETKHRAMQVNRERARTREHHKVIRVVRHGASIRHPPASA